MYVGVVTEQPRALVDHWRRIPNETIVELGRITVLAGAIEGIIYGVADWLGEEILGLAHPRRCSVSQVRRELMAPGAVRAFADAMRLDDPGRWASWLGQAGDALTARNDMVHARMIYVWEGENRLQYARASRDGRKSPRPIREISEVRSMLEAVADEGEALHLIAMIHGERMARHAEVELLDTSAD